MMNDAIRLNNEAVLLLREGKDFSAMQTMERALELGKMHASRSLSMPFGRAKSTLGSSSLSPGKVCIHRPFRLNSCGDSSSFFLYNQALEIPTFVLEARDEATGVVACSVDDEDFVNTCCTIMIFNMALLFHRRGCHQNGRRFLSKANALYSLALQILKNVSRGQRRFEFTVFTLRLAIANNLAHVTDQSSSHWEELMEEVCLLMNVEDYTAFLESDVAMGIQMNIFFAYNHMDSVTGAPAA
mmetsp:Transcript_16965/g.31401  ORF Transcript_16965/g.31401 Transcript_16965/m.31401 type:complete len:242 (-) Transcript_16965:125-850(-)